MATVEQTITALTEMGFSKEKSMKALAETNWSGVERAMEWLLAHPEDDGTVTEKDDDLDAGLPVPEPEEKTETKVLTEEEKAEQMQRLEKLRVQKRREREEKERMEELEREKRRVQDGKSINQLKQNLAELEMKKIAEERRREKMEDKLAKERVKAQIAADREAMKAKQAKLTEEVCPAVPKAAQVSPNIQKLNYDETKLQIRQTDGTPLLQSFKAKEPLSVVRLFAQLNRKDTPGGPVKLMTSFPRKVFEESDYDMPLESLGLVPSAVLMICKP